MRFPSDDRNESIALFEDEQWEKGKGTKKLIISLQANVSGRKRKQKRRRTISSLCNPSSASSNRILFGKKEPTTNSGTMQKKVQGGTPAAGKKGTLGEEGGGLLVGPCRHDPGNG